MKIFLAEFILTHFPGRLSWAGGPCNQAEAGGIHPAGVHWSWSQGGFWGRGAALGEIFEECTEHMDCLKIRGVAVRGSPADGSCVLDSGFCQELPSAEPTITGVWVGMGCGSWRSQPEEGVAGALTSWGWGHLGAPQPPLLMLRPPQGPRTVAPGWGPCRR